MRGVFFAFGLFVHLVLLYSAIDIYYTSPLVKGTRPHGISTAAAPAKRIAVFSAGQSGTFLLECRLKLPLNRLVNQENTHTYEHFRWPTIKHLLQVPREICFPSRAHRQRKGTWHVRAVHNHNLTVSECMGDCEKPRAHGVPPRARCDDGRLLRRRQCRDHGMEA